MHDDDHRRLGHCPGMDNLERKYRDLIARLRRYPMTESGRAAILAEIERQYRAALEGGVAERQSGKKPSG